MKIIRRIIVTVGLIIVFSAVASVLLPGSYRVTSSTLINAPAQIVFRQISDFARWNTWDAWANPAGQASNSTPSTGPESWREWKNGPYGYAKATNSYQDDGSDFYYRLLFGDHGVIGIGAFQLQPEGKATRVDWTFSDKVGLNPIKRWFALNYSLKAGNDLDRGLANLKQACERNAMN